MSVKSVPLKRRNKNNPQIKSYTEAIRRGQKSVHVLHDSGVWAVKKIGADSLAGSFKTVNEASRRAKEIAKRDRSEVFIHSRDGLIRERHSYAE